MTLVSSVFVATPALPAAADVPSSTIVSAGPLTSIDLGNELSCQVVHVADTANEFYPPGVAPGDCGTFLAVGGTLFAPNFSLHDATATGSPGIPFTPVSQTSLPSPTSPSVTTIVDAGTTGIRVTQFDRYVVGQESYRTDIQVENNSEIPQTIRIFRAGDCYLGGSDAGFGYDDPSTGTVGCRESIAGVPGNRLETWVPITDGSTSYEASFGEVWSAITTQGLFPDTCECELLQDNGAGISWEVTILAGETSVLSHLTSFSPAGTLPLSTSKVADSSTSDPAGQNGYTITVSNPNTAAVVLDSIVDFLPSGFSYVPDSTTGATTANPSIGGEGGNLTWPGPFPVPGDGSISLHFNVIVSDAPGEYFNEASASAGSVAVAPTGPTAPIIVAEPAVQVDLSITKVDEPDPVTVGQNAAYHITVANVGGTDATSVSVTDSPQGGTPLSGSGDGWTCGTPVEGSITCTLDGGLAAGATASPLTVLVQAPGAAGSISNTATVSSVEPDSVPANNTDTESTTVAAANGSTQGFIDGDVGGTLVTDSGQTGANNRVSVQMTVNPGQPSGVYTLSELVETVANSKGAAVYSGPVDADSIFIQVSCDQTQCVKKKLPLLDKIVIVIKENPDGSQQILPPCDLTIRIGRRVFHITNPPPCLDSVVRNGNSGVNPGDLVWTVEVLGDDPTIKGRG